MDGRFAPLPRRQLDIGAQPDTPPAAQRTPAPRSEEDLYRAKATEAAVKFESFFIAQTLHKMRDATRAMADEDSIFKDSINRDMLDMADNLVADQLAGQRAFGVADAILRQLLPPVTSPKEISVLSKKDSTGA